MKSPISDTQLNKRPARWSARLGVGVVMALLVACFGVLIAANRATPANAAPFTPAADVSR